MNGKNIVIALPLLSLHEACYSESKQRMSLMFHIRYAHYYGSQCHLFPSCSILWKPCSHISFWVSIYIYNAGVSCALNIFSIALVCNQINFFELLCQTYYSRRAEKITWRIMGVLWRSALCNTSHATFFCLSTLVRACLIVLTIFLSQCQWAYKILILSYMVQHLFTICRLLISYFSVGGFTFSQ